MAGSEPEQVRRAAAERQRTLAMAAAFTAVWLVPNATESAVANGDTRTVTLSNQHTNESGSFTYMVNGVYDQATLDKLNWFCRDWRLNEPTKMDPHLFDIIWEVYRESGLDAADRRSLRHIARRKPTPCCAGGRARSPSIRSTCKARRSTRISSTSARRASATSPCACRRAASASIRPATRPGCISTAARFAIGRK